MRCPRMHTPSSTTATKQVPQPLVHNHAGPDYFPALCLQREFGFVLEGRAVVVDDARVRATGKGIELPPVTAVPPEPGVLHMFAPACFACCACEMLC